MEDKKMTKKELWQMVDKLEELKTAFEFKLKEIAGELENAINLIDELIYDLEYTYNL